MTEVLYFFTSKESLTDEHPNSTAESLEAEKTNDIANILATKVLVDISENSRLKLKDLKLIGHVSFTDTPPSNGEDREVDIAFIESYYEGRGLMQAMIRYLIAFIATRCKQSQGTCRTTRRSVKIKPTPYSVVFKLEDMTDLMCEQNISNLSTVKSVYHSVGFEFSSDDGEMELKISIYPGDDLRKAVTTTNSGQPYSQPEVNNRMDTITLEVVHVSLDENGKRRAELLPQQFSEFVNHKTVCARRGPSQSSQGGLSTNERIVYKGHSYKLHYEGSRKRYINCKKEGRKIYLSEIKFWQRQQAKMTI
jgi:hypothetical protein